MMMARYKPETKHTTTRVVAGEGVMFAFSDFRLLTLLKADWILGSNRDVWGRRLFERMRFFVGAKLRLSSLFTTSDTLLQNYEY
jgi:hypothetical protein